MKTYHFIAGLPRSGTTLLAAILRQNPKFHTGIISPVYDLVASIQRATSIANETSVVLTDDMRIRLMRHCFEDVYQGVAAEVVFDNYRLWTCRLPLLAGLFPDFKMLCCVRSIKWIIDSLERQFQNNPFNISRLLGCEPSTTMFMRVQNMLSNQGGFIKNSYDALAEAFFGPYADRIMFIEYDALAKCPKDTIRAIYDFLKIEAYEHDFDNIEQVPGAAELDAYLGAPGLHLVRSKVSFEERKTILPPAIFSELAPPFWQVHKPPPQQQASRLSLVGI